MEGKVTESRHRGGADIFDILSAGPMRATDRTAGSRERGTVSADSARVAGSRFAAGALAALAGALLAGAALAESFAVGALMVETPIMYERPLFSLASAGYLEIANDGPEDDRLIAVEGPFRMIMLHETVETDGKVRMKSRDAVEIPAGATVSLAPGGLHVMFMGSRGGRPKSGDSFPATLIFEKAGPLEIEFSVLPR